MTVPSVPSVPIKHFRAKKTRFNFIKKIPLKKVEQKIEIAFKFTWKILYKLIGPWRKNTKEFLLNLIWIYFTGKSFVFFSTFRSILKKSNLEGVFEFFIWTPNLTKILNPIFPWQSKTQYAIVILGPVHEQQTIVQLTT